MKAGKLVVVLVIVTIIAAFFALGGQRYLTFEAIKAQQAAIVGIYQAHPAQTIAVFFLGYVAVTALSLPGAALMTLLAGAIFGLQNAFECNMKFFQFAWKGQELFRPSTNSFEN